MWAPDRHQASPRTVQDHLLKTDQQKTLFIQDYNWSQTLILTRTNHTDVANVQNQTKRSSSFSRLPFGAPSNETGFNSLYSPLPFSLDIYLMESHEERHGCCFKVCVFLQLKKCQLHFQTSLQLRLRRLEFRDIFGAEFVSYQNWKECFSSYSA